MSTRRRFLAWMPLGIGGITGLTGCGDKAAPVASPLPAPLAEPTAATSAPPVMVPGIVTPAPSKAPAPATASASEPASASGPAPGSTGGSSAMVSPQDPAAVALGYVSVATQADSAKYTKYETGQHCGSCALYAGKPGDTDGPCPLFGGRHVAATGWCSAYVKKA